MVGHTLTVGVHTAVGLGDLLLSDRLESEQGLVLVGHGVDEGAVGSLLLGIDARLEALAGDALGLDALVEALLEALELLVGPLDGVGKVLLGVGGGLAHTVEDL